MVEKLIKDRILMKNEFLVHFRISLDYFEYGNNILCWWNIGTDPRKFPLFLISRILASFRNCSSDWKYIIWMQFYAVKTALKPDNNLQIY
jgi:hypothetical protein